jgi:pyruvate formate lyase activating enzyme
MSSQQVIDEILKDRIFYEESAGGVTFSGGEPLMQPEFLYSLLSQCRNEGIHITLDTSGYAPQSILEKIVDYVDLFLYDLKLFDDEEHKKYTGVSNELIHQNLSFLIKRKQDVIIRIPIIPGITDTSENLSQIGNYLSELQYISRVDILPYNKMSKSKYTRLEKPYKLNNIVPPSEEGMNEIKHILKQFGLKVKIGG